MNYHYHNQTSGISVSRICTERGGVTALSSGCGAGKSPRAVSAVLFAVQGIIDDRRRSCPTLKQIKLLGYAGRKPINSSEKACLMSAPSQTCRLTVLYHR